MSKLDMYENLVKSSIVFGETHQLLRFKVLTLDFDFDFKRTAEGEFKLVGVKAVIRVLGKTTKVPLGEAFEHQTYETAHESTRERWSTYFKDYRDNHTKSPREIKGATRRTKAYRQRQLKKEESVIKRG